MKISCKYKTEKMEKVNYFILTSMLFVCLYSCSPSKKDTNVQEIKTVKIDTIYLHKKTSVTTVYEADNPISTTNILYLTTNRISSGETWKDEQGSYFFYRLLFASMGEHKRLVIEKIGWISDESDHLKLVGRAEIQEKDFDGNWWYNCEPRTEWISPTVVKLSFTTNDLENRSEKEFDLDISKIRFNQIPNN